MWNTQKSQEVEADKAEALESAAETDAFEFDKAPIWRRRTIWWLDRERELRACYEQLRQMDAPAAGGSKNPPDNVPEVND